MGVALTSGAVAAACGGAVSGGASTDGGPDAVSSDAPDSPYAMIGVDFDAYPTIHPAPPRDSGADAYPTIGIHSDDAGDAYATIHPADPEAGVDAYPTIGIDFDAGDGYPIIVPVQPDAGGVG
jgi:hypothetical protein